MSQGCYEFLLCSYDLLRPKKYGKDSKDKVAVEEKKIIEEIMRTRFNIPRAEYDTMLKALRTVDGDSQSLLYMSHRMALLAKVPPSLFANTQGIRLPFDIRFDDCI